MSWCASGFVLHAEATNPLSGPTSGCFVFIPRCKMSAISSTVAAALAKSHFACAGDLLTRSLETEVSPAVRSELLWHLARSKRRNGHLRDAVLAAQKAQDEVGLALCSCEAHFEEGAAWQELDCTKLAAVSFQRALATDPLHEPSLKGIAYCKMANGNMNFDLDVSALYSVQRPGAEEALQRFGELPRGVGIVVQRNALSEKLADDVLTVLRSAPLAAWRLNQRGNSGTAAAASRGVSAANMSYFMFVGARLDDVAPSLRPALTVALKLQPHERLLLNASKYTHGSFLDSHTDAPSGSRSHERVRAFVLHLSKDFGVADGGAFIDEECGERYVPVWNTLVHFEVPRWHSVTAMATLAKERFAIYGWIVVPKVQLVSSESALQLQLYQHRMLALFWPGSLSTSAKELVDAFGRAAHKPAPSSSSGASACTRGDYIMCCSARGAWQPVEVIPAEVSAKPAVLLFVDRLLVGHVVQSDVAGDLTEAIESLFDSAWSHLRDSLPVLCGRNGVEDRLCVDAMRFHMRLPQLAFVVGCSKRQQSLDPGVMKTILDVKSMLQEEVFAYVTTNPQLCAAFGKITEKQIPTVVVHGSVGSVSFCKRLLEVSTEFNTLVILEFVRGVLRGLHS